MKKILFASLLIGLLVACHKDFDNTTVTQPGPIPTVNVQSSLYGRVVNSNGNEVAGATVQVAGLTLTTNSKGLFFVNNRQLDQNGTYVQVKAAGYFPGARFAYPHLGGSAFMEVILLENYNNGGYSTAAAANISVSGGASVQIPAQSLVTATGQAYTGAYTVSARWLDPSNPLTYNQMPGDLRAQNADGDAKVLKTFGMIGVEIYGSAGDRQHFHAPEIAFSVPQHFFQQ